MYARPPVTGPQKLSNGLPLLLMCCLLFIVLLIASTIVLALIPVYLERKDATLASSKSYYAVGDFDGSLGNDGQLDASARDTIARAIEKQLGLPTGSIVVDQGTVATSTGRRKRRSAKLSRFGRGQISRGLQRLYLIFHINRVKCLACRISPVTIIITVTIVFNGQTITIVIVIRISVEVIKIPATLSPSTAATTTAVAVIGTGSASG
ncbi:unnamed protein product [Rotaria socialis]|uniref:Uncharacterized protein n=1 Tax=Rotaria socialis TaxID=392032 RepID=A0A817WFJ9_9BILA|nr:unnamed protein product [Rotaria socialis]CAF3227969.1 unnamed protein product [Rotaria socialis]CAF3320661.1 unnamed protein product [Rotaria socialis]CAF3354825.1 unnamed protein product [Rotaria socialis]CAF4288734.1 unnamed protein product [Rotaria socialis]